MLEVFGYFVITFCLAYPFALVAALPLSISIQEGLPPIWRGVCIALAFTIVAAYFGLLGYVLIPEHYILGEDPERAMQQSLWDLLGEEEMYSVQYQETAPDIYRERIGRV